GDPPDRGGGEVRSDPARPRRLCEPAHRHHRKGDQGARRQIAARRGAVALRIEVSDAVMPDSSTRGLRLAELAQRVDARLDGDGDVVVVRVATLEHAGPESISFLANPRYRAKLAETRAAAVVVAPEDASATALPKLIDANPYATFARVATILHPIERPAPGIHATAQIVASAHIARSAAVGAGAVIGARATIGERVVVGANGVVGADASIADDAIVHAGAILYPRTVIGARSTVHSGAVIGAHAVGIARAAPRGARVAQLSPATAPVPRRPPPRRRRTGRANEGVAGATRGHGRGGAECRGAGALSAGRGRARLPGPQGWGRRRGQLRSGGRRSAGEWGVSTLSATSWVRTRAAPMTAPLWTVER